MANGFFIDKTKRFVWNIDENVGPGAPNKTEDVQLVQLGYLCFGTSPKSPASPAEKAIYAAVVPGAVYSGKADDPLTIAIKTHQKKRGGTQDGVVSSIKSQQGTYDGHSTWMLIPLNNNIFDVLGANWPHLGRHGKCPTALRDASLRVFPAAIAAP